MELKLESLFNLMILEQSTGNLPETYFQYDVTHYKFFARHSETGRNASPYNGAEFKLQSDFH